MRVGLAAPRPRPGSPWVTATSLAVGVVVVGRGGGQGEMEGRKARTSHGLTWTQCLDLVLMTKL